MLPTKECNIREQEYVIDGTTLSSEKTPSLIGILNDDGFIHWYSEDQDGQWLTCWNKLGISIINTTNSK